MGRHLLPMVLFLMSFSASGAGTSYTQTDTIRFPISDRYGNYYTTRRTHSFDLRDTGFISRRVEYDPRTRQYIVSERIGNREYRAPATFSMSEFLRLQARQDENEYFRRRASMLTAMNRKSKGPQFRVNNDWFNRIMGVGPDGKVRIEVKPAGYVDF